MALRIWGCSWSFNLKKPTSHTLERDRRPAGHFTLNMQALLFCLLLAGLASVTAQATSSAGQVTLYSFLHESKLEIWLVWSRSCPVWWGEWPGGEPHPDGESGKPGGGSSWVKLLQQNDKDNYIRLPKSIKSVAKIDCTSIWRGPRKSKILSWRLRTHVAWMKTCSSEFHPPFCGLAGHYWPILVLLGSALF